MKARILLLIAAMSMICSFQALAVNRYVVISDSQFTQAYGDATARSLGFHQLQNKVNAIFHVLGAPGATTANRGQYVGAESMIEAVDFYKGRFGVTGVYIFTGSNDFGLSVPIETYKTSLRTLLSAIQSRNLGVACFSPLYRYDMNTPNAHGLKLQDYRNAMQSVCAEYGYVMLTFDAVASDLADGLHLNHNGHTKFANWIANIGVYLGAWSYYPATSSVNTRK